ncbi:hypothetical protein BC829DRAFT_387881, partial [Chytridium lagenaria]
MLIKALVSFYFLLWGVLFSKVCILHIPLLPCMVQPDIDNIQIIGIVFFCHPPSLPHELNLSAIPMHASSLLSHPGRREPALKPY